LPPDWRELGPPLPERKAWWWVEECGSVSWWQRRTGVEGCGEKGLFRLLRKKEQYNLFVNTRKSRN
jgi:hypothetical protein